MASTAFALSAAPEGLETTAAKRRRLGPCGGLLNQEEAQALDQELFTAAPVEQLMELAGLSCASAVPEVYPAASHPRVVVICGPGNNGGDGLVAARHLHHFGYKPTVLYPVQPDKTLYKNLVKQLEWHEVPVLKEVPEGGWNDVDVVMDCIFGFSFKGAPRPPFDAIVERLAADGHPPIVSVDIPSGWDVNEGPGGAAPKQRLMPEVLVSLSAPKLCAAHFSGRHFLGGRFIPPNICEKYELRLPQYQGVSQVVELEAGSEAPSSKI